MLVGQAKSKGIKGMMGILFQMRTNQHVDGVWVEKNGTWRQKLDYSSQEIRGLTLENGSAFFHRTHTRKKYVWRSANDVL